MREHFLKLARQNRSSIGGRISPLRFHEMYVRVPEAGKNKTIHAVEFGSARWNRYVGSDSGDFSVVDKNGGVHDGCVVWRWENLGADNGKVGAERRGAKVREKKGDGNYFRNTMPPFITNVTFCKTLTSASGLPGTAIISAK